MSDRDFLLFDDQKEYIDLLTDEQAGKLIKAIYAQNRGEAVAIEDAIVKMAFMMFWKAITNGRAKREKLRENAIKGGRPKNKEEPKQNQDETNAKPNNNQNQTKGEPKSENGGDDLKLYLNLNVNNTPLSSNEDIPPRGKPARVKEPYSAEFLLWWAKYPNKSGKDAAWNAWQNKKRAKRLPSVDELIAAVERFRNTEKWQEDGGRFIPNPSTWLNQGRWMDELPETESIPRIQATLEEVEKWGTEDDA